MVLQIVDGNELTPRPWIVDFHLVLANGVKDRVRPIPRSIAVRLNNGGKQPGLHQMEGRREPGLPQIQRWPPRCQLKSSNLLHRLLTQHLQFALQQFFIPGFVDPR